MSFMGKKIEIHIVWILVILLMSVVLGFVVWLQKPLENEQIQTQETPDTQETSEELSPYTSEDGSFSFLYPSNLVEREGDDIVLGDPTGKSDFEKVSVRFFNEDLTSELEAISTFLDNQLFEMEGNNWRVSIMSSASPTEFKYPGFTKSYTLKPFDGEDPLLNGRGFFTKFPKKDEYVFITVLSQKWSGENELFNPIFESLTFLNESKSVEALPSVISNNCYSIRGDDDIGSTMIAEPEIAGLFKLLPEGWEYATACRIDNFRNMMTVTVTRIDTTDSSIKQTALNNTKKYLPATYSKDINEDLGYFSFYLYPTWLTKLDIGDQSRLFQKNTLYPIVDLAWGSVLSGCGIWSTDWRNGNITISCGGGDNGCFSDEQISYSILSNTITNIGTCSKNCDLAEDEPATLSCSR